MLLVYGSGINASAVSWLSSHPYYFHVSYCKQASYTRIVGEAFRMPGRQKQRVMAEEGRGASRSVVILHAVQDLR